jgi:hypothetical protein
MASNKEVKLKLKIVGKKDMMFDRYAGSKTIRLNTREKLYLGNDDTVHLPVENIKSFLSAQNTESATKRYFPSKEGKKKSAAMASFVDINGTDSTRPSEILITRNGEPIKVPQTLANDRKEGGEIYVHESVARLPKGIPNEKVRPVIPTPWEAEMFVTIYPNQEITDKEVVEVFRCGGRALGFGTFRGTYGKFEVTNVEVVD